MKELPNPENFQVTTSARLLDKSIREWELAREEFAHDVRDMSNDEFFGPTHTTTPALFRAIDHLENCVDSTDRMLRLITALEKSERIKAFKNHSSPSLAERIAVRNFRNRIAHGDEDIAKGRHGVTATLRANQRSMEIQGHKLDYEDLAQIIERSHDFLRAAITPAPDERGE
jgi:hypothetical protein